MGSQLFLLPSNFADFDCCCFLCYCLQRADTSTNCSNPPALSTFEPYLCIRRHLTRMLLARIRLLSSCISYLHTQTNKRKKQTNSYLSRLSQQYHRRRSRGSRGGVVPPNKNLGGHVASGTLERKFSALRRLKNYLRSTTKRERLNKNPLRTH